MIHQHNSDFKFHKMGSYLFKQIYTEVSKEKKSWKKIPSYKNGNVNNFNSSASKILAFNISRLFKSAEHFQSQFISSISTVTYLK